MILSLLVEKMIELQKHLDSITELSLNEPISWVYLNTSEPKYLVFENESDHPKYVVQYGETSSITQAYQHLSQIAPLLPQTVPSPIACIRLENQNCVLVQTGMPGVPWFTIRNCYQTFSQWNNFIEKMAVSLREFHSAISTDDKLHKEVVLAEKLEQIAQLYKNQNNVILPSNFDLIIEQQTALLEDIGPITCHFQHGDFCINNLLVSSNRIAVIDFEHFGVNVIPYHDEFLLTSSVIDFTPEFPKLTASGIWEKVINGCKYKRVIQDFQISALFLHYILWWKIESDKNPRRKDRSSVYEALLQKFCLEEEYNRGWRPNLYFSKVS